MTNLPATEPTAIAAARAVERRRNYIAGLRDLADYLEAHPDVPTPYSTELIHFPDGTDEQERAEVDRIAAILEVPVAVNEADTHYSVTRRFGPLAYKALAIRSDHMRRVEASDSYRGVVEPEQDGSDRG